MSKELDYITELERKNRLLGERCNQLLKDKGELIDKVKELQDHLAEEVELHLHAEEYIKSLEKENEQLRNNGFTVSAMTEQQLKVAIEKGEQLEKQIEKMKEEHKQNELGLVISNSSARVELNEKVEQLEKENAELKGLKDVVTLIRANNDTIVTLMQLNNKLVSKNQQLAIAKDLIHQFLIQNPISDWLPKKAEQFLKEIEK